MQVDTYHIHTGLDGFSIVKKISSVTQGTIKGQTILTNDSSYLLIEALAQLGALHTRYLCDFNKHVFLIKINEFRQHDSWVKGNRVELSGRLKVNTQSAVSYELTAQVDKKQICSGQFLFAAREYDQMFDESKIKAHYQKVFKCLTDM